MLDPRDDARDRDGREDGRERVYDERDRDDDPREGLMRDLDLPRGEERELVVHRDRVYELDGEDRRTLAAVGAFRVAPEHDLDIDHNTLDHLRDEGLVETVDLGDDERGLTLTREGRDLLDSHSMGRDNEPSQAFYAGVSRGRGVEHDSTVYATYRQEDARLRDDHGGLEIRRVVLDHDPKREYQEFLQDTTGDALTVTAARTGTSTRSASGRASTTCRTSTAKSTSRTTASSTRSTDGSTTRTSSCSPSTIAALTRRVTPTPASASTSSARAAAAGAQVRIRV